jgi:predicted RND superfamily exporter protein
MFAAVFLCSIVAFRSFTAGFLVLVPLIIGNVITFAVMALAGVGLFIYTLPVSALGIGVGVDYSLYILTRLREECHEGNFRDAFAATFKTSGRAVVFTSLTVTAGVTALCFSEMRFQAILGIMLGVIMMANMFSSMFVLTALVAVVKPKFIFKNK